jgi:hypothetical protein
MKTVAVTRIIPVSAASACAILRTGDRMDLLSPAISACTLDGKGPGATRVCVIEGRNLDEIIETVDDAALLFQYRIVKQDLMPVANVQATTHITPLGDQSCSVLWFANFDLLDKAAWPPVKAGMEGIYAASIDRLAAMAAG